MTQEQAAGVVESQANLASLAGKYLTFALAKEIYGIQILKVQEIIGMMDVTRVPRTAGFVRGVINLRGKVIPVVDLRIKFGMEPRADTEKTCIIVVQIDYGDGQATMGAIVDEVSEVCDIEADRIDPPPSLGVGAQARFILGMGKIGGKVVMLLDVDSVLAGSQVLGGDFVPDES